MRFVAIASLILLMAVHINMEEKGPLDDILVYPIAAPAPLKIRKRESSKDSSENFNDFIEEKLTQQSQALGHIVKTVDHHEDLFKQLIEKLSKNLEKPKLPVKVEPQKVIHNGRRSYGNEQPENSILRLGKNFPKYGRLAKDLFLGEFQTGTDPTPLVEQNPEPTVVSESTRRSNGGSPGIDPSQPVSEELSSWCIAAMLCAKTVEQVCGFDDHYGYGKFDDICHMLHVNCYYKYSRKYFNLSSYTKFD